MAATDLRQTIEHYQPWRQLIYAKPLNITNHDGNWYTSNHWTIPTMTATDIRQTIEHYQPWRQLIYVKPWTLPTMTATDIRQTIEHYQPWRQLIYVKPLNTTHHDGNWYTFKPLNITIHDGNWYTSNHGTLPTMTATDICSNHWTLPTMTAWLIYVQMVWSYTSCRPWTATDIRQTIEQYQPWRQLIYVKPLNITNHDGNWYTSNHWTLPTMTATDIRQTIKRISTMAATDLRQTIEHYQPWRQLIYVKPLNITNYDGNWYTSNHWTLPTMTATDIRSNHWTLPTSWRQLIYAEPLNIYQPWRHSWYTFKPLNIYQLWRQLIYVKPLNITNHDGNWYTPNHWTVTNHGRQLI